MLFLVIASKAAAKNYACWLKAEKAIASDTKLSA
jgi:hypothetical protein